MKITAVAVGTRGDVNPLVELGVEMNKHGHEFRILAQQQFRQIRREHGLEEAAQAIEEYVQASGKEQTV